MLNNLSNTDRLVLWGLLGFIAYELWKPSGLAAIPQTGSPGVMGLTSLTVGESTASGWIQQLSGNISWVDKDGTVHKNVDFYTPQTGMFGRCFQ